MRFIKLIIQENVEMVLRLEDPSIGPFPIADGLKFFIHSFSAFEHENYFKYRRTLMVPSTYQQNLNFRPIDMSLNLSPIIDGGYEYMFRSNKISLLE